MKPQTLHRSLPSFLTILLASSILRVTLILYSEWHDKHSLVKYTDVDYRVFSDAARFLLHPGPEDANHAQGILEDAVGIRFYLGNPYMRETYRYTPLLALLLTPNEWLHPSFGKYLFALCDLVNGILIYKLLLSEILPSIRRASITRTKEQFTSANAIEMENECLATFYSALHLLNPMVFSISTRGSSESVLSLFVLSTLYAALKGRWDTAALFLGLSTHWKIYPVIYGVACLGIVAGGEMQRDQGLIGNLVKLVCARRGMRFIALSVGTFLLLTFSCYLVWGYPFLYESYLYHLHRLDHRHNFSPYFYLTYLTYPSATGDASVPISLWSRIARSSLISFVPQMTLVLTAGLLLGRRKEHLVFAWFVQTYVFVLFNKVCTSQYFLWYLLLFPLLLPRLHLSMTKALAYLGMWIGTQALWLSEAYKLEFLGQDVFFGLWLRSMTYFVANCWILAGIMSSYDNADGGSIHA